jgi:hypothetical protein
MYQRFSDVVIDRLDKSDPLIFFKQLMDGGGSGYLSKSSPLDWSTKVILADLVNKAVLMQASLTCL